MSRKVIETGVSVKDERVMFDAVTVRRRSVSWVDGRTAVVVEPPSREMTLGDRVVGLDADCGYGRVVSLDDRGGIALFTSSLGGEFTARVAQRARVLPDVIEASVKTASGAWVGRDITRDVLALPFRSFRALVDGPVDKLAGAIPSIEDAVEVELAAAISFYFGRLPDPVAAGLTPSFAISQTDLHQARAEILRMEREASMQAEMIAIPEIEMEMAPAF